MADPSELDAAIVALLAGDLGSPGLAMLMPDGVFMDVAPAGKSAFVIVSLAAHEDEYVFEGSAFERSVYLVKAVHRANGGAVVKAAAARIHELLQDQPLAVSGYSHMMTRRAERVRYTEIDDEDRDIRWQHRGGRYEVFVCPQA